MASLKKHIFLAIAILILHNFIEGSSLKTNAEIAYSFQKPFTRLSNGFMKYWQCVGDAVDKGDIIRLTPAVKDKKGAIWTESLTDFRWWEVNLKFHINGPGEIGGDGLAFWYTENKGQCNGTVFGSSDRWTGLGVFVDTFDNDKGNNNPFVGVFLNNGSKEFEHENDGSSQHLGGCAKNLRNTPTPIYMRIEYYLYELKILIHQEEDVSDKNEICFAREGTVLPKFGYFGISAATGNLSDIHDVYHFLTTSLIYSESADIKSMENQLPRLQVFDTPEENIHRQQHTDDDMESNVHGDLDDFVQFQVEDNHKSSDPIFFEEHKMLHKKEQINKQLDKLLDLNERVPMSTYQPPVSYSPIQEIDATKGVNLDEVLEVHKGFAATVDSLRNTALEMDSRVRKLVTQAKQLTLSTSFTSDGTNHLEEMQNELKDIQQDFVRLVQLSEKVNIRSSCISFKTFLILATVLPILVLLLDYFKYWGNPHNRCLKGIKIE